ncbi:M10 family metallopeptidase C-terminal domain-containing protein [Gallibacterium trehalosifermentans]|uniref:M10 family metallopeptidase C-terminal domain-containing protein n=1 Tax=Gallibacterium trehalosifermentans TaxID=516935 RepID=A0ABV6H0X9_9PAST
MGEQQLPTVSGFNTLIHELGHSLGMKHPFASGQRNPTVAEPSEQFTDTSIMNYNSRTVVNVPTGDSDGSYYQFNDSKTQLSLFDIAYMTYFYGVNQAYHADNNTYRFAAFNPQSSEANNGAEYGVLIVDGNGRDVIDATDQTASVHIDLTPGSWNYVNQKNDTIAYQPADNPENATPQAGQLFISYNSIIEDAKGGTGNDTLIGNDGANYLYGYDGDDTIIGGAGNDQLDGGRGADTLTGGTGADQFIFASPIDGKTDTIVDFNAAEGDKIVLDSRFFKALTRGTLAQSHFHSGTAPADADDFLIYDKASGKLQYDEDGTGNKIAVTIATLQNHADLLHANIEVV